MAKIKRSYEFLDHIIHRVKLVSFSQNIKQLKEIGAIILLCKSKEDSFNILVVHQSPEFSNSLCVVNSSYILHEGKNKPYLCLIFQLVVKDAHRKSLSSKSISNLDAVLIASCKDCNISIFKVSDNRLVINGISNLILLIIKDIPKLGSHCRIHLRGVLFIRTLGTSLSCYRKPPLTLSDI